MSCATITDIAVAIWNDIGQPTDTPVSYIQSKLVSQGFLGQFNSLTANCYSLVTGDISPPLGIQEQGIYTLLYEVEYYTRKVNALLNGTDVDWVRLTDGDSTITRSSTIDKARLLRDMQKQLQDQLDLLINSYRQTRAQAGSVDYYSIDNGWNPGYLNEGGGIFITN